MSHPAKMLLLILCAGAVYALGNARIPLWDRDEPRNAQAARQMLTSGDWVVPRFLDKVRTAKPPFTAWCQMGAMALFGQNSFAARLPSVIAMTLTLAVLAVVLGRFVDHQRAAWTVLILASSAIVIAWSARTSLTDSVLLLWVTIAQICLYAVWRGNRTWPVVITWAAAVGLAGLTKGPVVLGVQGMTLLALAVMGIRGTGRRPVNEPFQHGLAVRATIKAVIAIVIITAIAGPWMYLVEHRAPGFLWATTSRDVVQRVFEPLEQHKGPPGYYALVVWGIYFPWSVLLPLTFVMAWRHFREDASVRFALGAVAGPWIMLECVQTKLPHYLLPVFPPLAYLTADAIVRCLRGEHDDLTTRGTRGATFVWTLIVIGLGFLPLRVDLKSTREAALACAIVGILYGGIVTMLFRARRPAAGLVAMGLGMMLAMGVAFAWYLPAAQDLRLSVDLAAILARAGGSAKDTKPGDVQMIAYKEPSLAFYQGGTIRERGENDFLLTHPPGEWPRFLVIREDVWDRMPEAVKSQWQLAGVTRGRDLADKARTWTVYVLRKREG